MKELRKPIIFCCLCLLLLSCEQQQGVALRFGLASAPVTLDPRFATDATSGRINRLLYESLIDFDENVMPVPALADWQIIHPRHYRFTLRDPKKKFHSGQRLTSADVKATYAFILDSGNASPQRSTLSIIERMETPDALTIDFYLHRADPVFPGYLVVGILPADSINKGVVYNKSAMGSGPYRFLQWPEEGRLRLERVRDKQLLEFVRVPDTTVRVLKLVRNEIDMLQNDLSPELVGYLRGQDNISIQKGRGSNFTYLGFNMQDEFVGNLAVRQAIAHAINREELIRYLFAGAARPASALLVPQHWASEPGLQEIKYDPQQASSLLKTLGYDKQNPLKLSYKTSSDPFRIRVATVIQQQLSEVGIKISIHSYDWGTFYADIKAGNFQMYSLSWVGIHTPDIFHYIFHSESTPPNGANRGRYEDTLIDEYLEQAQNGQDLKEQAMWYRKTQQRLIDTLPYVPLWYEDHVFIANKSVTGYGVNIDGNYDGLINISKRP